MVSVLQLDANGLLELLQTYSYLLLFLLMLVEGPLVTILAGSLVALGKLDWSVAFVVIVVGDVVSDAFYYYLGRSGHRSRVRRILSRLGLSDERLSSLQGAFRENGAKVLVGGKLSHFAGTPVLVAAGLARVNFGRFLFWDLVATLPKSAALMVLGFFFGEQAGRFDRYLDVGSWITLALVLAALISYLVISKRATRKSSDHAKNNLEDK